MPPRSGIAGGAAVASLLLAVAASAMLLFVPTGTKVTASAPAKPGDAPHPTVVTRETLLEHEGPSVLVVLALPVAVAGAGLLLGALAPCPRLSRAVVAGLLWTFCVLGAASVGLLYVPAAIAMLVATLASPPDARVCRPPLGGG